MAEIPFPTTWDVWNHINNGKTHQPQLVSERRISAINSIYLSGTWTSQTHGGLWGYCTVSPLIHATIFQEKGQQLFVVCWQKML